MTKDHLVPGGKSLSGDGSHSPRINVAVPADWKAELDQAARDQGTGTSKLVRKIIGDWLAARRR